MADNRILVLAPHTDDAEFGCGGAMARWIREGREVFQLALSAAEASVPAGMPRDILRTEIRNAADVLGIPQSHLFVGSFPVRQFPQHRQSILDELIRLGRDIRPSMVLLPSTYDTHQDHQVVFEEGFRAFKKCSILGYEVPWNNPTFSTQAFVVLSEEDLERKLAALRCYESQSDRPYASADYIRSLALTRGMVIDAPYAEAFELVRWIVR